MKARWITMNSLIFPVIVSGGSGTRLWPLSRTALPKQFIKLVGGHSLFEQTLARVRDESLYQPPFVVCAEAHRAIVRDIAGQGGYGLSGVVMEPCGRNTAPALAAAALAALQRNPEAMILMLPSDHYIPDVEAFNRAVRKAARMATHGHFVLFGVAPQRPHTGFGYIQRGAALDNDGDIYAIASFREKPDFDTARGYIDKGGYYWNSGIFLMRAKDYMDELERHEPAIAFAAREAWAGRQMTDNTHDALLDEASFRNAPDKSIDYAVMEHTTRGCVIPVAFLWDDLGSWDALWDISPRDAADNAVQGDVITHDVRNCFLRSDGPLLCAVGIEDIVAVAMDDAVFLAPRSRSEEIRHLIGQMKDANRQELVEAVRKAAAKPE